MLSALSIVSALLSLLRTVVSYFHDRRLLEEGAALELAKALNHANEVVSKANAARQSVRRNLELNPDSVRDDDGFKRPD